MSTLENVDKVVDKVEVGIMFEEIPTSRHQALTRTDGYPKQEGPC